MASAEAHPFPHAKSIIETCTKERVGPGAIPYTGILETEIHENVAI